MRVPRPTAQRRPDGNMLLRGHFIDQARLHGALMKVRDRG